MRIIEGKGPPALDTFGNNDYLYKDVDTGLFYRCCGNINEDRTLPYGPAHKHPGEQYLWTPVDGNGGTGGGGAEIKTCNVTFKGGTSMMANRSEISFLAYTALVNGKIENVVLGKYDWGVSDPVVMLASGASYVLENVVCGTQMSFVLNDFGNGNDVTFDENFIQNVNDDCSYGIWLISSDATDFDLEVSSYM